MFLVLRFHRAASSCHGVLGAFTELPVDELSLCLWCCAFTELPAAAMVCEVLSPSKNVTETRQVQGAQKIIPKRPRPCQFVPVDNCVNKFCAPCDRVVPLCILSLRVFLLLLCASTLIQRKYGDGVSSIILQLA